MRTLIIIAVLIIISGCVTKNYPTPRNIVKASTVKGEWHCQLIREKTVYVNGLNRKSKVPVGWM